MAKRIESATTTPFGDASGARNIEGAGPNSIGGLVVENWLAFVWQIMGARALVPRKPVKPFESPFDVDAGERITRFGDFPSSERPYPHPYMIGAVSGLLPLQDQYSRAWAFGRTPSGPGVGTPIPVPFDAQYPTLPKRAG
jgi:hypothetical protein